MTKCPSCKKTNTFRSWEGPITVMGVEVLGRGDRCSCGEILFDDAEMGRQERDAAGKLVERGVRTAIEFKFIRKMISLRATELAEIFDVDPKTVGRWESGERPIPKAIAFTLGELYARPQVTRRKLTALAG